jgi:trimethylamine-N-oxide reductase (cytochrome c)
MGQKKKLTSRPAASRWGGACRAPHGNEFARGMIALATMQGIGKARLEHLVHDAGHAVVRTSISPAIPKAASPAISNLRGGLQFAWRMFDGRTTFPVASRRDASGLAHHAPQNSGMHHGRQG